MKKTIILIVLAAALGAYVYFYEIKGGEERDKEKATAEKLFNFEKDSVDRLEIQSVKGHYVFVKGTDGWRIEQPVQTGADESPINSLLSSLADSKKERTIAVQSPADKAQYGIGSLAVTVAFSGKKLVQQSVIIGDETSIGYNCYAASSDKEVHIVGKSLKTNADKTLFDWRDKRPVLFKKDDVREFTLTNPNGTFQFVKDGGDWKLTEPLSTLADKAAADEVLNKLDYGRIKAVAAESATDLKSFGLEKPAFSIDLFSGAEKARTGLVFSAVKNNSSYGRDAVRPHIFEVDSLFIKPFRKNLFEFRDKHVINFEREAVNRISLFHSDSLLIVEKDTSGNWKLSSGEKVKSWKISNFFSSITNLQAKKFAEEPAKNFAQFGLTNPQSRIELFNGQEKIAELVIGSAKDKLTHVFNPGRQVIVTVEESSVNGLFPPRKELLEEVK